MNRFTNNQRLALHRTPGCRGGERPSSARAPLPEQAVANRLCRRSLLWGGFSLAGLAMLGCDGEPDPLPAAPTSSAARVPLRVLLAGDSVSAEHLDRAWGALDAAPLAVEPLSVSRADAASLREDLLARVTSADIVIYPLIHVADLFSEQQIVPVDLDALPGAGEVSARLATAVRSGVAKFADQVIGLPLGGAVPSVFSVETMEPLRDWKEYDRLVGEVWGGAASEPTAPGWAGMMFLWRAATSSQDGWLFDRQSFEPLIAADTYVETLDMMVTTHKRYATERLTPGAIWTELQRGSLRGGITIPPAMLDAFPDLQLTSMPSGGTAPRVLFDAFTPVASITAACRQSALAKQFLAWLATADGTAAIAQSAAGARRVVEPVATTGGASLAETPYDDWLKSLWQTPLTHPTLQILNGGAYYQALDEAVGEALEGRSTPAEALAAAASRWRALTAEAGASGQIRLWHQAHGRRG